MLSLYFIFTENQQAELTYIVYIFIENHATKYSIWFDVQ